MAHELHRRARPFVLHYSVASRASAGFLDELAQVPWADHVRLHVKDEGGRADLAALLPGYAPGDHLYTCGSARYMESVLAEAARKGWPESACHCEYFSVPQDPDRIDSPFTLHLSRRDLDLEIPAGRSATDVLEEAGILIDVKCADGICGVCAVNYDAQASSPIEHRDHVLSARERESRVVLCSSRCAQAGGRLVIDL
ncbi:MAG: iron-sulfur cluster-binding domain-containing protein [Burkholderiaceae bacterium]